MQDEHAITLERIRIHARQRLANQLIDVCVTTSEAESFIYDSVDLLVTGIIYGETGDPLIIEYPANWIEAIKARWLPAWLKRRFPVRLVSHCVTTKTLYPHFRISMPAEDRVLRWNHLRRQLTDPVDEETLFP